MDAHYSSFNSKDITKMCSLCLSEVPSHMMHTLKSCGCRFCVNCLRTYLSLNIRENNLNALVCPDPGCPSLKKLEKKKFFIRDSRNSSFKNGYNNGGAKFAAQEIQILAGEEMFNLYKKYKFIKEVDEDPHRTWCPKANCDSICVITRPSVKRLPSTAAFSIKLTKSARVSLTDGRSSFYCSKCNETYCTVCRQKWHDTLPCKSSSEAELLMVMDNTEQPTESTNIKRCPRCKVWIERNEGCAQMLCVKCKHVFCWFCLQNLEDDFLLRHYDKGPCKNKLGHSRPSVLWHRTQVVAIFAGFGVLLLLAAPLFLIASPCILCCNCCCNTTCKYLDEKDSIEEEDGFNVFE